MPLAFQLRTQIRQMPAVIVLGIAGQQVQARLADGRDQACSFQGQLLWLVRINYHEDAANGLHDRLHFLMRVGQL